MSRVGVLMIAVATGLTAPVGAQARIAYEKGAHIWVAAEDGSGADAVASTLRDGGGEPAISPNGSLVAYYANRHGGGEDLRVVAAAGGGDRLLFPRGHDGGNPNGGPDIRGSPDGRWLTSGRGDGGAW